MSSTGFAAHALDNSYLFLLLSYGLVFFFFYMFSFVKAFSYFGYLREYMIIGLLSILIIVGFMETTLIKPEINSLIILFSVPSYLRVKGIHNITETSSIVT